MVFLCKSFLYIFLDIFFFLSLSLPYYFVFSSSSHFIALPAAQDVHYHSPNHGHTQTRFSFLSAHCRDVIYFMESHFTCFLCTALYVDCRAALRFNGTHVFVFYVCREMQLGGFLDQHYILYSFPLNGINVRLYLFVYATCNLFLFHVFPVSLCRNVTAGRSSELKQ